MDINIPMVDLFTFQILFRTSQSQAYKLTVAKKVFFFYQARTMSGEHNSILDDYKMLQHIFFSLNESTCSICIFIGHAANYLQ